MSAEMGTQQQDGHGAAKAFTLALQRRREQLAGRVCLGCGAKTDERGVLPCGH